MAYREPVDRLMKEKGFRSVDVIITSTEGWVAHFTGSDIATRFPSLAA